MTSAGEPHPPLTSAGDLAKPEKKLKKPKLSTNEKISNDRDKVDQKISQPQQTKGPKRKGQRNVIDLNEVLHSYSDGHTDYVFEAGGGSEVAEKKEDTESERDDSKIEEQGSDGQDNDDKQADIENESSKGKLVFEVDSESPNEESANESLSDEEDLSEVWVWSLALCAVL